MSVALTPEGEKRLLWLEEAFMCLASAVSPHTDRNLRQRREACRVAAEWWYRYEHGDFVRDGDAPAEPAGEGGEGK